MPEAVRARVVVIGSTRAVEALAGLPVEIRYYALGKAAMQWLKTQLSLDAMVTRWSLPDMPDGALVERVRAAKPWLPTIVLVARQSLDMEQSVRALGVTAVLTADGNHCELRAAIQQIIEHSAVKT